jgi:hypothetical protein
VTLAWNRSWHKALKGYNIYVKDTVFDNTWRRAYPRLLTDTTFRFHPAYPAHRYFLAVTTVDTLGRESDLSFLTSFVPATPHSPSGLTISEDRGVPELHWQPFSDTTLEGYLIYRAVWDGPFMRYDSTAGYKYQDFGAESGVTYHYRITAENDLGIESPPTEAVTIMTMALNKGALFCDMNARYAVNLDAYHNAYIDRLYGVMSRTGAFKRHNLDDSMITFREMSNYSPIVFDCEQRGGHFPDNTIDSIRLYLSLGGKALIIMPNISPTQVSGSRPNTSRYLPGTLFYDYFMLDSSVTNAIVIRNGTLYGDLMGCQSHSSGYPALAADSFKLTTAPIPISGYIGLSGCLFPNDSADTIYTYKSLYPDSSFNGRINGLKNKGDSCHVILFNFSLSLMSEPENLIALNQALSELGVDFSCGDVNRDGVVNVGDIVFMVKYLFQGGPAPEARRGDVNADGSVDLADIMTIQNRIFRNGVPLVCGP